MLKDRITITDKGFQIQEDTSDPGRTAYYTIISLKNENIDKSDQKELSYYTVLNVVSCSLENRSYVCVWEMKDDKQVEEYSFFYSSSGKLRLQWSIERAKAYGESAYMLTLKWKDHIVDVIHKSHLWLKHKRTNSKFTFLKETISPLDPNASELVDRYIINMPPGVNSEDLTIEGDELLLQKYQIMGV